MFKSLKQKWAVVRKISADTTTHRQILRLSLKRYSYPGFKTLRRFFECKDLPALCTLRLKADSFGTLVTLSLRPGEPGDVASFFENWIEAPPPFDHLLSPPKLIVDAGAHIGCYALYLHSLYPDCEIIAFEPNRSNHNLIHKNFSVNGIKGQVSDFALWNEDTDALLMVEGESNAGFVSSSVQGMGEEQYAVPGITLLSYLGQRIAEVSLVKLDIEGAEYKILPQMLQILPARCQIWMELHDVALQPNWLEMTIARENWAGQLYESFAPHEMWRLWKKHDVV